MACQLKRTEKLPRTIRRIAKKRVQRILCDLTHPAPGRKAECIHEARKNLKMVRATLRLVRDEVGHRVYRRDARQFRKVARALSQQRDAHVQLKTAENLLGKYRGKLLREALMKLHRVLQERLREVSHHPNGSDKKLESKLRAACRHAKKWPVGGLKWTNLASGIGQTYKRASKAFQLAERTHEPEHLHEWRKRAKDLWYQLCILKPVQKKAISAMASRVRRIGQLLGDDHDLFMIGEASKTAELNCWELEAIADLAHQRRARLQKQALQLGKKLFSEKPSAFVRRMDRYGRPGHN